MTTMARQLPGYGPPTPVPIFQWEREFDTLLALYDELCPGRVLEIGTYHGGTLYHWLQRGLPDVVVSVDSYAVGVDNRHLYDEWNERGAQLEIYEADSHDPATVALVADHGPYDWLFIDAGHYLHEVTRDWELYSPLVREHGVVAFHDILPPSRTHPEIEVATLWEQIRRSHRTLEIVADRNADWGGIGVVLL